MTFEQLAAKAKEKIKLPVKQLKADFDEYNRKISEGTEMKTKQELIDKYKMTEDLMADATKCMSDIKKQLEAMSDDPKPMGRWKPGYGGEYWFIDSCTVIDFGFWGGDDIDNMRYALRNFYRTKQEAQAALDRQLATVRVLDRIAELNAEQGWVANFDSDQSNYFVMLDHGDQNLRSDCNNVYQAQPIEYYGSRQTIETVISEMGGDCRLMLGVV